MSTWLELREPGCVPELKGPFPAHAFVQTMKEFLAARPSAFITVLTITDGGYPVLQDGPEALEMADGRLKHLARRHRESTRMAHAGAPAA